MAESMMSTAPQTPAINDYGMMRVVGNKELNDIDKKHREDEKNQQKPELIGLSAHLNVL